MKIEETLYQMISSRAVELPRKAGAVLPHQTSDIDSYTTGDELERVEQEVFRVLKDITRDLMDGISRYIVDNKSAVAPGNTGIDVFKSKPAELPMIQNSIMDSIGKDIVDSGEMITTGNTGTDALKEKFTGLPVPQSDIFVLLISGKDEAPENPLKILVAYKTDKPVAGGIVYQETAKNSFFDAVVESAKKYAGISGERILISMKDGDARNSPETETGYIVRLSLVSQRSFENQLLQSAAAQKGEKDSPWQSLPFVASGVTRVARTESNDTESSPENFPIGSRAIDSQKISALYRNLENEKGLFEKLSAFAVEMEKEMPQEVAKSTLPADPLHAVVIYIEPAKESRGNTSVNPDEINLQSFQEKAAKETAESMKDVGTGESVSVTAFSGQEIVKNPVITNSLTSSAKSPITNDPEISAGNDVALKRLALFVDRVNMLLGGDTGADDISIDTPAGPEPDLTSDKLHLFQMQMRDAGTGPVIQASVKKIIFENEEFQKTLAIGLSIGKNNLLHVDRPILEGAIASNREETLNTLKGLGSSLYERINYFVHPYAGIYADNKEILQLRGSQKDEGALLLDKQLNKEQEGLEKRLNELQLLIERSTLVKEWLAEDKTVRMENNT